jgi:hypothetical protein
MGEEVRRQKAEGRERKRAEARARSADILVRLDLATALCVALAPRFLNQPESQALRYVLRKATTPVVEPDNSQRSRGVNRIPSESYQKVALEPTPGRSPHPSLLPLSLSRPARERVREDEPNARPPIPAVPLNARRPESKLNQKAGDSERPPAPVVARGRNHSFRYQRCQPRAGP